MKLTRRKLAAALAAPAVAVARTRETEQTPASGDALAAARARILANGQALAKETVPMTVEPAFQFKA